jgi:cysteine-rich repeat protein
VPSGYSFLGTSIEISAPPSTDPPLAIVFEIDASLIPPGENAGTIAIFRNQLLVESCDFGSPGGAFLDCPSNAVTYPCVLERQTETDRDVRIAVCTLAASTWTMGVERCGDAMVGPTEQCDDGNALDGDCCSAECSLESSATICREANGPCDVVERCTGADAACPADEVQPDSDGDGACDAIDPCADGVSIADARVKVSKYTTPLGDDRVKMRGTLPFGAPVSLTPDSNGFRVVLQDALGDEIFDAAVPGGAGWISNPIGTKWKYRSPVAIGGVVNVVKLSIPRNDPAKVKFSLSGRDGSYAMPSPSLPVRATLLLDPLDPMSQECGEARFPGPPGTSPSCSFNRAGSTLICK